MEYQKLPSALYEDREKAAPILRWVGGKRQLTRALMELLPQDFVSRRYVEPFLGGGSLFFACSPQTALLADANTALIDTYAAVRDSPSRVLKYLDLLIQAHSNDGYYEAREAFNRLPFSAAQAARFIYLNMSCFNGIYRVNRRGKFNVPKGSKNNLRVPSTSEYLRVSAALRVAKLSAGDYGETLAQLRPNDFVYLDPPYPALSSTAYFTHYTVDRFDTANEERLAKEVIKADRLGAKFLMSNADVPAVRDLYKGFSIRAIPVTRFVSCKKIRTAVSELLITNY